MNRHFQASGFTLIELIVVMAMAGIMLALTIPPLLGTRAKVDVRANIYTVISDIRAQQQKAMVGDTGGRGVNDAYGVHFDTTSYTLFHGTSYNPLDMSNATVALSNDLQFTNVTFPAQQLVFQKGSGELAGFTPGEDNFTLVAGTTQIALTATFNQMGVAIQVQ